MLHSRFSLAPRALPGQPTASHSDSQPQPYPQQQPAPCHPFKASHLQFALRFRWESTRSLESVKAVPITSQPYRPQPHHLLEGVVVSRAGPSEAWLRREKGGGDGRRAGEQRGGRMGHQTSALTAGVLLPGLGADAPRPGSGHPGPLNSWEEREMGGEVLRPASTGGAVQEGETDA